MQDKIKIISSMLIFGTIGLMTRFINLPSSILACLRGGLGVIFIGIYILLSKHKLNSNSIKKNFLVLMLSGLLVGINWMLLFKSFEFTSIAIGTVSYYFAPMIVAVASPFVFKEKMQKKTIVCVLISIVGMVLVSNIFFDTAGKNNLIGICFGLLAAFAYATITILNKFLKDIEGINSTITQLFFAFIVLIPYILLTQDIRSIDFSVNMLLLVLVIGIVHTALAYVLYFSSLLSLKSTEVAIYSYIDPAFSILISAIVLLEPISIFQIVGIVLILFSTFISQRKQNS